MSFIEDYFFDEVTIVAKGTTNVYGKWQYDGESRTLNARVVPITGVLKMNSGKQFTYRHEVYLPPNDPIALQDRVVIDDVNYEVLEIATLKFVDGSQSHRRARLA